MNTQRGWETRQGLIGLLPMWSNQVLEELTSYPVTHEKLSLLPLFFMKLVWGGLLYCINHLFFLINPISFFVVFIHISSIYIKLDIPYFHKVQIKRTVHCWTSSCFYFNNSNIFQSKASKVLLPPRAWNSTKLNNTATAQRRLHFVYKSWNKVRFGDHYN